MPSPCCPLPPPHCGVERKAPTATGRLPYWSLGEALFFSILRIDGKAANALAIELGFVHGSIQMAKKENLNEFTIL